MIGRGTIRLSSTVDKRRSLKRFQKYLSSAPKLDFLLAIYSIQKIQSSKDGALPFFADLPDEARTTDRHSKFYFHPWFLETLANELLAAPWEPKKRDGFTRTLDARSFSAFSTKPKMLLTGPFYVVLAFLHRLTGWQNANLSGNGDFRLYHEWHVITKFTEPIPHDFTLRRNTILNLTRLRRLHLLYTQC
ncbi:hypothetical protein RQ479_07425 [Mesorhizobium sp. ISC25]|uniref:hypothetical protein n=1 Tax=Mesorhizobium sp. ISC25 TaxID=3077335 RepID=UPI0035DB2182